LDCGKIPTPGLKGILFDLDGTLLGVNMRRFIPAYLDALFNFFEDLAERDRFSRVLRASIGHLLASEEGGRTNEAKFLDVIQSNLGIADNQFRERMDSFCLEGLDVLAPFIEPHPLARDVLNRCFDMGLKVAIATNPVFPRPLVDARLAWGGIIDFPYDWIASMENTRYCKPHPEFFLDVLATLELAPSDTLMVGNDTQHDLGARGVGIPVFLVDTWIEDRLGGVFAVDLRGDLSDLLAFLDGTHANAVVRGGDYR